MSRRIVGSVVQVDVIQVTVLTPEFCTHDIDRNVRDQDRLQNDHMIERREPMSLDPRRRERRRRKNYAANVGP